MLMCKLALEQDGLQLTIATLQEASLGKMQSSACRERKVSAAGAQMPAFELIPPPNVGLGFRV